MIALFNLRTPDDGECLSDAVDVWAFAVVLWEMLTERIPREQFTQVTSYLVLALESVYLEYVSFIWVVDTAAAAVAARVSCSRSCNISQDNMGNN